MTNDIKSHFASFIQTAPIAIRTVVFRNCVIFENVKTIVHHLLQKEEFRVIPLL